MKYWHFRQKKLFKNEEQTYREAAHLKTTQCPQPSVSKDRLKITTKMINCEPGVNNYIVWSHNKTLLQAWLILARKKMEDFNKIRYKKYFLRDYYKLKHALKEHEN